MDESDRTAIHEVMEHQQISIAKVFQNKHIKHKRINKHKTFRLESQQH